MTGKKYISGLLMIMLAAGLTACVGSGIKDNLKDVLNTELSDGTGAGGTEAKGTGEEGSQPDESFSFPANQEEEIPAFEDASAYLVYAKDNYFAFIYHGPTENIGMGFCQKDGSNLPKEAFMGYGTLIPGWKLGLTEEMSEDYTIDYLAVSVTDYNGEKTEDGTYPEVVITEFQDPLPEEKMKEIGFDYLDGRCCMVTNGRATYGSGNFGLFFGITWIGEDHGLDLEDIENFGDRFQFFAGDGTPLEEYFEGYNEMEISIRSSAIYVLLHNSDSTKAQNEKMCDELRACKPYMIYTGLDSTTQQFQLLQD